MLNIERETLPSRPYLLSAITISLCWLIASWFIADAYISWKSNQALSQVQKKARVGMGELYEGLNRTMSLLDAVPKILSRDLQIQHVVTRLNAQPELGRLPPQTRIEALEEENTLRLISHELADAVRDIGVISIVWVMRRDGLTIAASNAGQKQSLVGQNFSHRKYFVEAISGRNGHHYAIGQQTDIPGLYFSAPVRVDNQIVGVIAGKIDLAYLYNWISQTNGYLLDENNVIIQAANPEFELMVLPGAEVENLAMPRRKARYRQTEFQTLEMSAWDNDLNAPLYRLGKNSNPYYVLFTDLMEYNLKLMTAIESQELGNENISRQLLFLFLAFGGLVLIVLLIALTYHFKALQLAKKIRARQELIEHLASHDSLTGLYSRSLTDQLITQGIAYASRNHRKLAVLFIDVDLFKDINDSFGHEMGDEVLRELATRIMHTVSESDVVIRHGGDEFIVLLNDISDPEEAATLAINLQKSIRAPFVIENTTMALSASIGIALYPSDGETPSLLLRHADTALYNVKEKGRADYAFYQTQMSVDLAARKTLEADMVRGLENNEFYLVYQPQYAPGRGIIGCEALIRWKHPVRGVVPPIEFIPAAERSGFIGILGEWVINEACRQGNEWKKTFGEDIAIAINLSSIQFQRSDLLAEIRQAIEENSLNPGMLELELTESVLMADIDHSCELVEQMKAMGMRISIDDFGTGYSSLSYLKKFDAHILKIDRAFVKDMETSANDQAIINAVISMAKSLDYKVIAEGVETQGQFDMLCEMGCYAIQGYWFSPPLPPNEFETFYHVKRFEFA